MFNGIHLALTLLFIGLVSYVVVRHFARSEHRCRTSQYWAGVLHIERERFETDEEYYDRVDAEAAAFLKGTR